MQEAKRKPNMSESAFRMLVRCGMQFYWRYIEGLVIPPGISMVVGTATDVAIDTDLTAKKDTGSLRLDDEIKDMARDALNINWQKGIRLVGDELKDSQKKLKGEAVDDAVVLATMHHKELAPTMDPIAIQRFWKLELDNYPYDLTGRIDIEEPDKTRDVKTSAKSPTWNEAHKSRQLTIYSLARKVTTGLGWKNLSLDYLIRTKTPKHIVLETQREEADFQGFYRLYERAMFVIEKGAFMPNTDGWHCSDRYCGYWDSKCPFGRRSQVKSYPEVRPEEPEKPKSIRASSDPTPAKKVKKEKAPDRGLPRDGGDK